LAHRDDNPFAMCSTFKAYAAARVLQKAQRGELGLQQAVFIDPGVLLSLMTRSQSPNQDADPMALLIAEVTRSVLPWLTAQG
jgi:beta-lactamase class A